MTTSAGSIPRNPIRNPQTCEFDFSSLQGRNETKFPGPSMFRFPTLPKCNAQNSRFTFLLAPNHGRAITNARGDQEKRWIPTPTGCTLQDKATVKYCVHQSRMCEDCQKNLVNSALACSIMLPEACCLQLRSLPGKDSMH